MSSVRYEGEGRSVGNGADRCAGLHRTADRCGEVRDRAGLVRVDRLLHLHRLQDDDQVALGDLLTVLYRDLDDRALHRYGDRLAGRRRATTALAAVRGRLARRRGAGGPRKALREHDLEPPTADLDGDAFALGWCRPL